MLHSYQVRHEEQVKCGLFHRPALCYAGTLGGSAHGVGSHAHAPVRLPRFIISRQRGAVLACHEGRLERASWRWCQVLLLLHAFHIGAGTPVGDHLHMMKDVK